jgi:hypothetical protein
MRIVDGHEREYRIVIANGVPVLVGYGASLAYADLSGTDLTGLDLSLADLRGAELTFAKLSGCNLSFADLSDANAFGADFRGANLRGAQTRDACLDMADLRRATYDKRFVRGAFISDELTPEYLAMLGVGPLDNAKVIDESLSSVEGPDERNRESTRLNGDTSVAELETTADDPSSEIKAEDEGERIEQTLTGLSLADVLADTLQGSVAASSSQSDSSRSGRRRDYSGLLEELSAGIAELTTSEKWTQYLEVQSRFYRYSPNNVMLILLQNPYATRVAGYKAWQALGRQVMAKQSALRILAPMTYKKDDGLEGEKTSEVRGFKLVPVFDISQTDGSDLPDVVSKLEGFAPEGVFDKLTEFANSIGFRVERPESLDSGANGDTTHAEGRIRVVSSSSGAQQAKTLAHEIGHALLHDPKSPTTKDLDRGLKELEAESAAYVICTALDMDTSDYSFGYVAGWAGGGSEAIQGIKESAVRIQRAATAVLKSFEVEEPSIEVANEPGVEMELPEPAPNQPQQGSRERDRDLDSRRRRRDSQHDRSTELELADGQVEGPLASEVSSVDHSFDDEQVNQYCPLSSNELEVLDAPTLGDREVEFGR